MPPSNTPAPPAPPGPTPPIDPPPAPPVPPGPTPPPPNPPSPIITFSFAGPIQPPASKNLRNACCGAVNNGAQEIRILFSSSGGLVEEGFSLHNFLRALPVKLVMHCVGSADSIAMIVFLAGAERFCCADSTFMFHDFGWGSQTAVNFTRVQFLEFYASFESFKVRSQQLLKTRASFTDADFIGLGLHDKASIYDAAFAKSKGIVHDIRDAQVPPGGPVLNIDF